MMIPVQVAYLGVPMMNRARHMAAECELEVNLEEADQGNKALAAHTRSLVVERMTLCVVEAGE